MLQRALGSQQSDDPQFLRHDMIDFKVYLAISYWYAGMRRAGETDRPWHPLGEAAAQQSQQ